LRKAKAMATAISYDGTRQVSVLTVEALIERLQDMNPTAKVVINVPANTAWAVGDVDEIDEWVIVTTGERLTDLIEED